MMLSMRRFTTTIIVSSWVMAAGWAPCAKNNLEDCFSNPPESARPWVYWYWMDCNVSREGITHDLEGMAEAGIGGAYLMSINKMHKPPETKPPAYPLTDHWWDLVKHAAGEADRLGLRLAMNACDGWSLAAGPWITPELSMKKVVWKTTGIEGPKRYKNRINLPTGRGKYRDYCPRICVLAYPEQKNTPVPLKSIIDISDKVDPDGSLDWSVPPGKWIIQCFAYTTTGAKNHPGYAGPKDLPNGRGLECDKFSTEAACVQFNGWFGEALRQVGPELAGRVLAMNHTDSWEVGEQNWSDTFHDEFMKRRGYDPVRYLPCLSGTQIESKEVTERFNDDMKRTVSDLVNEVFYKTTADLSRAANAKFSAEIAAPFITCDGLQIFLYTDIPMGEFWIGRAGFEEKLNDIEDAVSGAHIYGKKIIQAEAYTSKDITWNEDPYYMKPLGDFCFAMGVNRFVLHVWAHQAFPDMNPGMTLWGKYGSVFSQTQTWHKPARAWFDYLKRCQAILQQGLPVVDVCYFIGEDLPCRSILEKDLHPKLPAGYDYDCINRDALLTRAKAENGRLVMPNGMTYRVLVLPEIGQAGLPRRGGRGQIVGPSLPGHRMTVELARKIGELAQAGVPVIGPNPQKSRSLHDHIKRDQELLQIIDSSWQKVRNDVTPGKLLAESRIPPDVEFVGADMTPVHREKAAYSSPPFCWNHRKTDDADIYFLSNQDIKTRDARVAFRVADRQPELWHPVTGDIRALPQWENKDGRTIVALKFEPAESYFIVCRNEGRSSKSKVQSGTKNFADYKELQRIEGAWDIKFEKNRGAPKSIELTELISLTEHEDFGVKHFSGTAIYRKLFDFSGSQIPDFKSPIMLNLGEIHNIAQVTLNGKDIGTVWCPPYRLDTKDALKDGTNTLEIKVTNTWRNRIIGDKRNGNAEDITTLYYRLHNLDPDTRLEPFGLIGPVTLSKRDIQLN